MKINNILSAVSSLLALQRATAFAIPPTGQQMRHASISSTTLAMGNPIDGEYMQSVIINHNIINLRNFR